MKSKNIADLFTVQLLGPKHPEEEKSRKKIKIRKKIKPKETL